MFGIPFTIVREGDAGGVINTIYLRTYRRGRQGNKMRECMKAYRAAIQGQAKAAGKIPVHLAQATKVAQQENSLEALEKLAAEQDAIITESNNFATLALAAAEEITDISLSENYGEGTNEIMNGLTDRELHAIVGTLEMGEMPKDFFQFVEAQKKASITGRSGDTQVPSSLAQGSQETTSKVDESVSKTQSS